MNKRVDSFKKLEGTMHVHGNMCVDAFKKLGETMHVHGRHLSQNSTFDLFFPNFFPIFKFPNSGCGLSASVSCATALDEEYLFSSTVFGPQ